MGTVATTILTAFGSLCSDKNCTNKMNTTMNCESNCCVHIRSRKSVCQYCDCVVPNKKHYKKLCNTCYRSFSNNISSDISFTDKTTLDEKIHQLG